MRGEGRGGEGRPKEAAEEVDGGVLSQLPHPTALLGKCVVTCVRAGRARGRRGWVLNAVREAQKERKARQVLARVKIYSEMYLNCSGFDSVGFVGMVVLQPLNGSSVNANVEKKPTIST